MDFIEIIDKCWRFYYLINFRPQKLFVITCARLGWTLTIYSLASLGMRSNLSMSNSLIVFHAIRRIIRILECMLQTVLNSTWRIKWAQSMTLFIERKLRKTQIIKYSLHRNSIMCWWRFEWINTNPST